VKLEEAEAPVLSKNQLKKLAKRAKFVEQRQARKQNRKEQVMALPCGCGHFMHDAHNASCMMRISVELVVSWERIDRVHRSL
jgi:hypothetical protein